MRKPTFCICENKDADQLIHASVFATWLVPYLFFLNKKFQASCGISSACIAWFVSQTWSESTLLVFSRCGSIMLLD